MGNHLNLDCRPYLGSDDQIVVESPRGPQTRSVGTQAPRGFSSDTNPLGGDSSLPALPPHLGSSFSSKSPPPGGDDVRTGIKVRGALGRKEADGEVSFSPSCFSLMGHRCVHTGDLVVAEAMGQSTAVQTCDHAHKGVPTVSVQSPEFGSIGRGEPDNAAMEAVEFGVHQTSAQNPVEEEMASNVTDPDRHIDSTPPSPAPLDIQLELDCGRGMDALPAPETLPPETLPPDSHSQWSWSHQSAVLSTVPPAPPSAEALCTVPPAQPMPVRHAPGKSAVAPSVRVQGSRGDDWTGWVQGMQGMMSSINGGSGSWGSPNLAVAQHDKFPEYSAADAKLKAREWQFQLKLEMKGLDREIKKVQLEEGKLKKAMTLQAQKGETGSVEQYARSIVRSRQAVARLRKAKAAMTDIDLHLTTAIASMSMKHAMRVSADAMRDMSKVAPISEIGPAVQEMQREMAYSTEVEDAVEEALHNDDDEAEASTEVQKVLEELELERLGLLTNTRAAPPLGEAPSANAAAGAGSAPLLAGQRAIARQGGS